jgi:outer membrane protein assembly factor BamB
VTTGGHEDTFMWALGANDGSVRFQTSFRSQWERWTAPAVDGSNVVTAGGYYGGMYGFDRTQGNQRFFLAGPQVSGWGPALGGGLAYRTGGGVQAVRATDGTVVSTVVDPRLNAVTTPVLGTTQNLLMIVGGRLMSVDLQAGSVKWDQSGDYKGLPVVGDGVVYGFSGSGVAARRESDGALLWTWVPPAPYKPADTMVLTRNVLFLSATGGSGATFALDLATQRVVWQYPMAGRLAVSAEGVLYIVLGVKVVAVDLR